MIPSLNVFDFLVGRFVMFRNNVHRNFVQLVRISFLLIQMIPLQLFQIMRRLFNAIIPMNTEEQWLSLQPILKELV